MMQPTAFQEANKNALMQMYQNADRLLLADETGLGKTYTTISLIHEKAAEKAKTQPHFHVLYICSNDAIARKNMDELCSNLAQLTISTVKTSKREKIVPLIAQTDVKKMARQRNARLSTLNKNAFKNSFVRIFNATPETSFRCRRSKQAPNNFTDDEDPMQGIGTAREREVLARYCSDKGLPPPDNPERFFEARKLAGLANARNFDLIILDEFQSYENVLSELWEADKARRLFTVEALLQNCPNCQLLLLSATPYQMRAEGEKQASLEDFGRLVSFLNKGLKPAPADTFSAYQAALLNDKCTWAELLNAKRAFEADFRRVCVRNQRSDAAVLSGSGMLREQSLPPQEWPVSALCAELAHHRLLEQQTFLCLPNAEVPPAEQALPEDTADTEAPNLNRNLLAQIEDDGTDPQDEAEEDSDPAERKAPFITPDMRKDTPWPATFGKGYLFWNYPELQKVPELFYPLTQNPLAPASPRQTCQHPLSGQVVMLPPPDDVPPEIPVPSYTGKGRKKDSAPPCTRFLPNDLSGLLPPITRPWPSWKAELVRELALDAKRSATLPPLMQCAWLPPTCPDQTPESGTPYGQLYGKNATKTLVFCHYQMTTRSLAALLSLEAASGPAPALTEAEWQSLFEKQPYTPGVLSACKSVTEDNYTLLGHPYICAERALRSIFPREHEKSDLRSFPCKTALTDQEFACNAALAAGEFVRYLRDPRVLHVLGNAGVKTKDDLLRYCANGNLTAMLREYWTEHPPEPMTSGLYSLFESLCQDRGWAVMSTRQRFETALWAQWERRTSNAKLAELPEFMQEDIRHTEFALSVLLAKNKVADVAFPVGWDQWDWESQRKKWLVSSGFSCNSPGTYIGFLFERFKNNDLLEYYPVPEEGDPSRIRALRAIYKAPNPNNAPNARDSAYFNGGSPEGAPMPEDRLTPDSLVKDQIRVCADALEHGKVTLAYRAGYYNARLGDSLLISAPKEGESLSRTALWKGDVQILGSHGMFDYYRLINLWDGLDQKGRFFPKLPDSHACMAFSDGAPTGFCARVPLGFACRYTSAVQDSDDHNDDAAEDLMHCFNSPLLPMVLSASDVAKEGLSFHAYCRRLIHLSPTKLPAVQLQRNGRVDRYHGLALRQRRHAYFQLALSKGLGTPFVNPDWEEWGALRAELEHNQANTAGGMIPDWCIPERPSPPLQATEPSEAVPVPEEPCIEVYHLNHPGTEEPGQFVAMRESVELYARMLGTLLPETLLPSLKNRCTEAELKQLQLDLRPKCPKP